MLPLLGVMLPPLGVMLLWLIPGLRVMLLGTGVILNQLLSQILGQMLHLLMVISILLGQNEPGLIWLWVMLILRLWVMLLPMLVGSVWLMLQVEARVMVGRVSGLWVIWLLTIVFDQLDVVVAIRQGLIID